MEHFRTYYEKAYDTEEYFWGTEPAEFCQELLKYCEPSKEKKVLDIGCGEGKDAVFFAKKGFDTYGFDLTETGIRKTKKLAETQGVSITAWVDDVNTFETDRKYDIIYSTGTVQYLFEENKEKFFRKIEDMTNEGGIVFFNVFVDKPFLELPPDWDNEEKMWKTGELFTYFDKWEVLKLEESIFECHSSGVPHLHCMDTIICKKRSM